MEKKNLTEILDLPFTIKLIKEGDTFYTEVEEIPGCWSEGSTVDEAYVNIKLAMKLWLENAIERNLPIPLPRAEEKKFSGRIMVRMPKEFHKNLVERAEKEKISLNQFIVYLLSSNFSFFLTKQEIENLSNRTSPVLCDRINQKYGSKHKSKSI